MAIANTTTASDLIVPQVWADFLAAKIPNATKFRPLVDVDTTLQGQPGNTVTYPVWDYIGDAADLAELVDVPLTKMGATTSTATIKNAAKGVAFSDQSILSAAGNPTAEGNRQLVQSIAQKVDKDIHAVALANAGLTAGGGAPVPFTVDNLIANMPLFGEDADNPDLYAGLVVSPKAFYTQIIADARFADASKTGESTLVTGRLGSLLGIPIFMSSRTSTGALLVQKGSLGLLLKRDVLVEKDRDIVNYSTIVTASMHYGASVPRPSGVMKFAADA